MAPRRGTGFALAETDSLPFTRRFQFMMARRAVKLRELGPGDMRILGTMGEQLQRGMSGSELAERPRAGFEVGPAPRMHLRITILGIRPVVRHHGVKRRKLKVQSRMAGSDQIV